MSQNSFLQSADQFHFDTYKPQDVELALDQMEKSTWERLEAILTIPDEDRTFENTVLAFSRSAEELEAAQRIIVQLEMVLGEPWSPASLMVNGRIVKLASDIGFHEGLYKALI